MVGRPAPDVDASRRASSSSSSTTTGCSASREPAAVADGARRLAAPTSRRCIAPLRDRLRARDAGHARSTATTTTSRVTPRGGEPERFDEVVLATHSDQALRDARRRDRPRARAPRRDPVPAQRGGPAHRHARCCRAAAARGRAGTTTCSTRRPACRRVTYHMNRLQALDADREFCVTLNRTEAIDPAKVIRTIPYAHPVFTARGRRARRRATRRSAGRNRTHFCGAYWGWGFHEDGVVSALRVARALRERACDAQRALRGHGPPPPLRGPRARAPPPDRAGLRRPRRAPAAARRAAARAPAGPRPLPPPRLPRRPGRAAARRGARARARRTRRTARSALLTTLRTLGHCFNPVSFYYCFDARRARCRPSSPRSPTRRGASATPTCSAGDGRVLDGELDKALHVSPFMGMDQRYAVRASGARARRCRCTSRAAEAGERAFDATLTLQRAAPLRPPRARRRVAAHAAR